MVITRTVVVSGGRVICWIKAEEDLVVVVPVLVAPSLRRLLLGGGEEVVVAVGGDGLLGEWKAAVGLWDIKLKKRWEEDEGVVVAPGVVGVDGVGTFLGEAPLPAAAMPAITARRYPRHIVGDKLATGMALLVVGLAAPVEVVSVVVVTDSPPSPPSGGVLVLPLLSPSPVVLLRGLPVPVVGMVVFAVRHRAGESLIIDLMMEWWER